MLQLLRILLGFLLILLAFAAPDPSSKSKKVKYAGPIVYSNLPPPVVQFPDLPSLPQHIKKSSPAINGHIEYVPFPYQDLPVLIYRSKKEPPVHLVNDQNKAASESYRTQIGDVHSDSGIPNHELYHNPTYAHQQQQHQEDYSTQHSDLNPSYIPTEGHIAYARASEYESNASTAKSSFEDDGSSSASTFYRSSVKKPSGQYMVSSSSPPHIVYSGHPPIHIFPQPVILKEDPGNQSVDSDNGITGDGYAMASEKYVTYGGDYRKERSPDPRSSGMFGPQQSHMNGDLDVAASAPVPFGAPGMFGGPGPFMPNFQGNGGHFNAAFGGGERGLAVSASNNEATFASRPHFGESQSFHPQGAFGDHRESFGGGGGSHFSGEGHQNGGPGHFDGQRGFEGQHHGGGGGNFQQQFSGIHGGHHQGLGVGRGLGGGHFGGDMIGSASTPNFNFFNSEHGRQKMFDQNIRDFANNEGHGSFNFGGGGGGGHGTNNYRGQFVDDGEKIASESSSSSFVKENFLNKQPQGVPNGYGNQAVFAAFNKPEDAHKDESGESSRDTGFALLSALSNAEFSRDFFKPGPSQQQQQQQEQNRPPMPPQLAFLNSMLKDNMHQRPSASEFRPFKAQDFSDFYHTAQPDQSQEEQKPQAFRLSKPIDITLLSDVEPLDPKLTSPSSSSQEQKDNVSMMSLLADYLKNGSPSYEQQMASSQSSFASNHQDEDQSSPTAYRIQLNRPSEGSSSTYGRPPIIIYQGIKPPIYVYKKPKQQKSQPSRSIYKGSHLTAKVVSGDRDFSDIYQRYMKTKIPNYKITSSSLTSSGSGYSRPITVGLVRSEPKSKGKLKVETTSATESTSYPKYTLASFGERRESSFKAPKKDSYFVLGVTKTSKSSPRSDDSTSYLGLAQSGSDISETWIPVRQRSRKTTSNASDATTTTVKSSAAPTAVNKSSDKKHS